MTSSANTHKLHEAQQVLASHVAIAAAISIFCFSLIAGILSDSIALLLDAAMGLIFLLVAFFVRFQRHWKKMFWLKFRSAIPLCILSIRPYRSLSSFLSKLAML